MTPLPDIAPAELVRAIEAQYDVRVTAPPTSLPPGFHSRAWRVATTRGKWIVKVSNPASDPVAKIERQIQLANYLNQHAIRAPRILPLSNGSFIATLTIDRRHYPMQLMEYQVLRPVKPESASDAPLGLIGELVARFHQILELYPERGGYIADRQKSADEWGPRDQGLWPLVQDLPDLSRISQEEQEWFHSIDLRAVTYIQQHFPDQAALSLALLHGDLNFEHIQFLSDGTPYLYDFGDMCWGPIAHELAVLFLNTYCASEVSFSRWEAIRRAILQDYSATRQLTDLDRATIPVCIVNRAVAWAQYSVELAHEEHMAIDWGVIKQAYRLAEYLLDRAEGE